MNKTTNFLPNPHRYNMAGVIYGLGANRRILHSASTISWHPYYIQTYLMVKTKRTKKKSVTMTTARTLLFHECEGIKFYKKMLYYFTQHILENKKSPIFMLLNNGIILWFFRVKMLSRCADIKLFPTYT